MLSLFLPSQSRRVSFANPIQQQETADDIDRRSPALRTSSPRRSKGCNVPQQKVYKNLVMYFTCGTDGFLNALLLYSAHYNSNKRHAGPEPQKYPQSKLQELQEVPGRSACSGKWREQLTAFVVAELQHSCSHYIGFPYVL